MSYCPVHIIIHDTHISIHTSRICLLAHPTFGKQTAHFKNVFWVYFYQKACPLFCAFKYIMLVEKTFIIKVENDLHCRSVLWNTSVPCPLNCGGMKMSSTPHLLFSSGTWPVIQILFLSKVPGSLSFYSFSYKAIQRTYRPKRTEQEHVQME